MVEAVEKGQKDLEKVWHWKMVLITFLFFSQLSFTGSVSCDFRDGFLVFDESLKCLEMLGKL
jgi:hypothetical protein